MKHTPTRKEELIAENVLYRERLELHCEDLRPAAELIEHGVSAARVAVKAGTVLRPLRRLFQCGGWTEIPRLIVNGVWGCRL